MAVGVVQVQAAQYECQQQADHNGLIHHQATLAGGCPSSLVIGGCAIQHQRQGQHPLGPAQQAGFGQTNFLRRKNVFRRAVHHDLHHAQRCHQKAQKPRTCCLAVSLGLNIARLGFLQTQHVTQPFGFVHHLINCTGASRHPACQMAGRVHGEFLETRHLLGHLLQLNCTGATIHPADAGNAFPMPVCTTKLGT